MTATRAESDRRAQGSDAFLAPRFAAAVLAIAAFAALFLLLPRVRTPTAHTILDSCIFLTSVILAPVLWDVGRRSEDRLIAPLAIMFFFLGATEFYHTLMAIAWDASEGHADPSVVYRLTGTWGPTSHVLPIGLLLFVLFPGLPRRGNEYFAAVLGALTLGAVLFFDAMPRFTAPEFLGITRPNLALAPLLWIAVGILYARRWPTPIGHAITAISAISAASVALICYSTTPYDAQALIAHAGKLVGHIFLLYAVFQLASRDITRRIAAETSLRELAGRLEQRVVERTLSLTQEMASRAQADARTLTQLARLNLLHEITTAIDQRYDLDSILQVAVTSVERQFSAQFVTMARFDPGDETFTIVNVSPGSEPLMQAMGIGKDLHVPANPRARRMLPEGEVIYDPDLSVVDTPIAQRLSAVGMRSGLAVPLLVEGNLFASMLVARTQRDGFSSGDREFLIKLATHVALAARQADLHAGLKKAYDDLQHSQKSALQQERLSALGQMASGIAHDINNAITPLSLTTQALMVGEPYLPAKVRTYLETVKRVVDDIAATVARMREFYRQRDGQASLEAVDLNEIVQQTVDLTRARWENMPLERGIVISMQTRSASSLPMAAGVASEIREALTNLIFNAVDAMPMGGGITISTGLVGEGDAARVALDVADTGVGMNDETRRRCLEPFFTTKGERGTGLGLAMVFGAMQRLGGGIEIDSAPGQGTLFRLLFQMAPDVPVPAQAQPAQIPSRLKILVVDDDPYVLDSMRMVLELEDNDVVTADGGSVALALISQALAQNAPFDVVFTDLGMPEMDGRALAGAIKARAPKLPVVLLTGWGKQAGEQAIGQGVDYALSKPATLEGLLEALAYCTARHQV